MPRICGLVSPLETKSRLELLSAMLAASQDIDQWTTEHQALGQGALGWCGWGQPNCAADLNVAITLEGAIFNREALGGGATDAALFLQLYHRYGFVESLRQLNGDFAIGLYDAQTDVLWLARDRFGLKPLYYHAAPERFAFASRPRALLALPGVSKAVNRQFVALFAASHYRYFDNAPEQSPYADLAQLPPAHFLRVAGGQSTLGRYWALEAAEEFSEPEAELAERYRALLLDATMLRYRSAPRPAFTLSGGMDSSSVLASTVSGSGQRQHAFSSTYTDKTYDETEEIRSMLAATVEQWHPVAIDAPDVFDSVRRMIAVHDEPVATATWLSHFRLCQAVAQQGFGSLFGGLGGDELNAGEYEHFFYFFADLRAAGLEERLTREVNFWARYHDHPIFRKSRASMESDLRRLVDLTQPGRCLPDRRRLERYRAVLNPDYFDLSAFGPVMEHPFQSYLKNRTYQDLTRETIPCCLRAEDRQTAAFGLDNFLPFFDHRLVEFMFRIPTPLKYRDGVAKRLLREAMRGVLPEETRTRIKKTGWNAPAHIWFSGAGREAVLDLVASRRFQERGIYQVSEVRRVLDDHDRIVSGGLLEDNHMMFLWQLVNLELWLQSLEA